MAASDWKINVLERRLGFTLPWRFSQQVAGSDTLECSLLSKYWKLAFPLGDASRKVRAGGEAAQWLCFLSLVHNGIQWNCMAFAMMGPDHPDHHLYQGLLLNILHCHPYCLMSFSFGELWIAKGKTDFCFCLHCCSEPPPEQQLKC